MSLAFAACFLFAVVPALRTGAQPLEEDSLRPTPADTAAPAWITADTTHAAEVKRAAEPYRGLVPLWGILDGSSYVPDSSRSRVARTFTDFVSDAPGFLATAAGAVPNEVDVAVDGGGSRHVLSLREGSFFPTERGRFRGRADWRMTPTGGIARVERARGPMAMLLGPGAAWGAVNSVRATPDTGGAYARASFLRGSDGLDRNRAELSRELSTRVRASFYVDGHKGDGDRTNADGSVIALGGAWWWNVRGDSWTRFAIEQSKFKGGVAVPLGELWAPYRERTEWRQVEAGASGRIGRGAWRAGYAMRQTQPRFRYDPDSTFIDGFDEYGFWEARAELPAGAHNVGGWVIRSTEVLDYPSGRFRQDALSGALYDAFDVGRFTLAGGLRGQRVRGEGSSLDVAASVSMRAAGGVVARASTGTSTAFASLSEMHRDAISSANGVVVERGNPSLRMERSRAFEIGLTLFSRRASLDLFAIARDVDDMVVWRDADASFLVDRRPVNVADATILELGASLSTPPLWIFEGDATYTYLRARDRASDLPYRPRHHLIASAGPHVALFGGDLVLDGRAAIEAWGASISSADPPVELPSASILTLSAAVSLVDATFVFEWHNVTDAEVELVEGEPQARRSIFYGLVWTFRG